MCGIRLRVQVIVEADDGTLPAVHEVAHVERDDLRADAWRVHVMLGDFRVLAPKLLA